MNQNEDVITAVSKLKNNQILYSHIETKEIIPWKSINYKNKVTYYYNNKWTEKFKEKESF